MSNIRTEEKGLIELSESDLAQVAGGFGPAYAGGTFSPDTLTLNRLFTREHKFGSLDYGVGFEMPVEFSIEPNGTVHY